MIRDRDDSWEAVATRVADGDDVAWEDLPGDDGTRRHLQWIEKIGAAYRDSGTVHDRSPVLGDEAPRPARADFTWGDLDVFEVIGRGSASTVYRAHDRKLDRPVALKLFDDGATDDSGLEEARRLARVRHRHLLTVFGADTVDGQAGMWTESIVGMDLEDELRLRGCWTAEDALEAGVSLCDALEALHEAGLAHGDLTPRNVLRERGGRLVVVDLGASTDANDALRGVGVLRTGTPFALPLECLDGKPTEARDDLYALGALLYRMLTDFHPIEAETMNHLLHLHREHGPWPIRTRRARLPEAVATVIDRALHRDPSQRFESAAAMADALRAAQQEIQPSRKPRLLVAALAVIAVTILVGIALHFVPDATPPTVDGPTLLASRDGVYGEVAPMQEVRVGERLHLELSLDEAAYVYVLNEDANGDVHVLFPLDSLDANNPLPSGDRRLPGTLRGRSFGWQVTSAGGEEHVMVLRSPEPIDELETTLALLPGASTEATVSLGSRVRQTLRGMAGLAPSDVDARAGDFLQGLVTEHGFGDRDDLTVDLVRFVSVP